MDEMNELPEVNFEEQDKEKRKKGFIPWLKQKLGIGSRGPVGAVGPSSRGFVTGAASGGRVATGAGRVAIGAGRAGGVGRVAGIGGRGAGIGGRFFGTAGTGGRFLGAVGSKGFLGGLIAGKAGTYLAAALIAAGLGIGVFLAMQGSHEQDNHSFNFDKSSGSYIPQIMRGQLYASSLDMLKNANEGFLGKGEEGGKEGEEKSEGEEKGEVESEGEGTEGEGAGASGMYGGAGGGSAEGNYDAVRSGSKLADAGFGKLTSSLGGQHSAIGGFGNKFGQGLFGPKIKSKFGSLGAGIGKRKIPRIGKSLAMTAKKMSVTPGKFGALKKYTSGKSPALANAFGVNGTQRGFTQGSIEQGRATHDQAWQGETGGVGNVDGRGGGGGVKIGGSDKSPSSTPDDSGSDDERIKVPEQPEAQDDPSKIDVPPPADTPNEVDNLSQQAMTYIFIAGILAIIASQLVKYGRALLPSPYGVALIVAGVVIALAAMALAIKALMIGMEIMFKHKQSLLGLVYVIGAGVALTAATLAMLGTSIGSITAVWAGAAASIIALLGSMITVQSLNLPDTSVKQQDTQKTEEGTGGTKETQDKTLTLKQSYEESMRKAGIVRDSEIKEAEQIRNQQKERARKQYEAELSVSDNWKQRNEARLAYLQKVSDANKQYQEKVGAANKKYNDTIAPAKKAYEEYLQEKEQRYQEYKQTKKMIKQLRIEERKAANRIGGEEGKKLLQEWASARQTYKSEVNNAKTQEEKDKAYEKYEEAYNKYHKGLQELGERDKQRKDEINKKYEERMKALEEEYPDEVKREHKDNSLAYKFGNFLGDLGRGVNERIIQPAGKVLGDVGRGVNEKIVQPAGKVLGDVGRGVNEKIVQPAGKALGDAAEDFGEGLNDNE